MPGSTTGGHEGFLSDRPQVAWLESHDENYFAQCSIVTAAPERIRAGYPLSLHDVGLPLGSVDPLDQQYLGKPRALVRALEPELVSEHLSRGSVNGHHTNALLYPCASVTRGVGSASRVFASS